MEVSPLLPWHALTRAAHSFHSGNIPNAIGCACKQDADEALAVDILFRAITAPMMQIAENAGAEGSIVLERCTGKEFGFGWNAATDSYENLLETGVLDPATVTQQAVLNSCSIAASVLTTSALITEIREKPKPMGAPNDDDGMGGMM